MTRDQAIERIEDAYRAAETRHPEQRRMSADLLRMCAESEVDSLEALGVLKLTRHSLRPAQDRCEPPPEHRSKEWHWLCDANGARFVAAWLGDVWVRAMTTVSLTPITAAHMGIRYVAPCEEPKP